MNMFSYRYVLTYVDYIASYIFILMTYVFGSWLSVESVQPTNYLADPSCMIRSYHVYN